ncbi:MAG TPA: hypothetical protein VL977_05765, partial [Solirubrobacteraceae bacterium]|nr:hypothetical protein [Solirubrobacteraceae bacterium]
LFALSLALLAAGDAAHVVALSAVGGLGAVCFGLGAAPLQLSRAPALSARLGFACALGLSLLVLIGSLLVLAPAWQPVLAAALAGAVALALHALGALRAARELSGWSAPAALAAARLRARRSELASLVCCVAGSGLWLGSALAAGHVVPGNGGFLTRVSFAWFAGLALLAVAIALARRGREAAAACAVASLLLALTLTPALVYGMPEVQTAGKHIEVVQAILARHRLDVGNGIYDAYSGFFSAIAWLCSIGRIRDAAGVATFWPCFVGLVGLVELRWLLGTLVASRFRIWAAIALAVLANTVEESYFSPQSLGLVLALAAFAIVLDTGAGAVGARARDALLVLAGCALALTHELSPFIAAGVLVLLALLRCARPRWAAAALLVPAAVWALVNSAVISPYVSLSRLFSFSNFAPPQLATAPGLARRAITFASFDALVAGLLVLIALALAGWLRHRRERWAWACILSPAVGLVFTAVNPYNNEGIYRAILFAIPWLALLAAHALPPRPGRWADAALALVVAGMVATFALATFALDGFTVIRSADLAALRRFEAQARPGSGYVNLGFSEVPFAVATSTRPDHYLNWQALLTGRRAFLHPAGAREVAKLTASFERYVRERSGPGRHDLYALWSPTAPIYGADYGLMSAARARAWLAAMRDSSKWRVVYSARGTYLFRLVR